jgi:uncharacterized protein
MSNLENHPHPSSRTLQVVTESQQRHLTDLRHRVRSFFANDSSGHDWWHTHRVHEMARRLARIEGADPYIVSLAALAHDLEDHKLDAQPRIRAWLEDIGVDATTIQIVHDLCTRVSFKGAGVPDDMPTLEGRCVQDADRLDAIGAIGIARTFAFGGSKGRALHDPEERPEAHGSFEAYKSKSGSSLNHFFEKLLLLKDRLHTPSARAIAQERHAYMEGFVRRFLDEWDARA